MQNHNKIANIISSTNNSEQPIANIKDKINRQYREFWNSYL